jgi:hypothetical protein
MSLGDSSKPKVPRNEMADGFRLRAAVMPEAYALNEKLYDNYLCVRALAIWHFIWI